MIINIEGNFITIRINANEEQPNTIQLPDGYSYENIHIVLAVNAYFHNHMQIHTGQMLSFPPVNSKSPCYLKPAAQNANAEAVIKFLITKFGQIPDLHYFDRAFEPILVTGEDGKEYKVIPSDQFK